MSNFETAQSGNGRDGLVNPSGAAPYGSEPRRGTDLDALTGQGLGSGTGTGTGATGATGAQTHFGGSHSLSGGQQRSTNLAETIDSYGGQQGHSLGAAGIGSGQKGFSGGIPDAQEGSILRHQGEGRLSSGNAGSQAGLGSADYGSAAGAGALGAGLVAGSGVGSTTNSTGGGLSSSSGGFANAAIDSTNYNRSEPYSSTNTSSTNTGIGSIGSHGQGQGQGGRFESGSSDPTTVGTGTGGYGSQSLGGNNERSYNWTEGDSNLGSQQQQQRGTTTGTSDTNTNTDYNKMAGVAGAGMLGGAGGAAAYAKQHGTGNETADRYAQQAPTSASEAREAAQQGKQTVKEKMEERRESDGFVNVTGQDKSAPGPFTGRVNPEEKVVETELKQRAPRDEQGRELDSYGKPYNV